MRNTGLGRRHKVETGHVLTGGWAELSGLFEVSFRGFV